MAGRMSLYNSNWWLGDGGTPQIPLSYDYGNAPATVATYGGDAAKTTQINAVNRRRRLFLLIFGFVIVLVLLLAGMGLALGLSFPRRDDQRPAEQKSSSDPPEVSLTIDLIKYFPGQEVVIDDGSHIFQCTASNVPSDTILTWDFGDNIIQTSRTTLTSEKNEDHGGTVDLTSTIHVLGIAQGDNRVISCLRDDFVDRKRKRRQVTSVVSINVIVQGESAVQDITLNIDSTTYSSGSEVELTEGPHTFECIAYNAEPNSGIAWDFDGKSIAPDSYRPIFRGSLQDIDSTIDDLLVSEENCNAVVRCSVVSSCSPVYIEGSRSVTVTLKVITKPESATIEPIAGTTDYDPVLHQVTVTENVESKFSCQVVGTDKESEVTFTLEEPFGTSFVTTNRGTGSSEDVDCRQGSFTNSITFVPNHKDHHGQRLICSASNSAGTLATPEILHLDVNVAPNNIDNDLQLKIDSDLQTEGSVVLLKEGVHVIECVTGYTRPVSTVKWSIGGTVVQQDAFSTAISGDLVSYTSIINSRSLTSDDCNVEVKCTASNTVSSLFDSTLSMSVIVKTITAPLKAEISITSGLGSLYDPFTPYTPTLTLIHGMTYFFNCVITGADEEADVTWTLTQAILPDVQSTYDADTTVVDCLRDDDTESFSFTADYDQHQDERLTCLGSNSAGSVNHTIHPLVINVAPTQSDLTLKIDDTIYAQGGTLTILEEDIVSLECTVSGATTPIGNVQGNIGAVSSSGTTTVTVTDSVTADTTASCMTSNSASVYTVGVVSKQVTINVAEPRDCYEILTDYQRTTSGEFYIYPMSNVRIKVWCDMDTDNGGWTVFQRRVDGSEDFYRDWAAYQAGFGSIAAEHWLGLDNIYDITNNGKTYQLRMDLDDGFETAHALYDSFLISNAATEYVLTLGSYNSGVAGDALTNGNGLAFSTNDNDNDGSGGNCAAAHEGAWWYNACHFANLNGRYLKGRYSTTGPYKGMDYFQWRTYGYSLAGTEMKLRPAP